MSQYIIKDRQNLFDIAVELYGSIEGIFDLLISNPKLSMCSQLKKGDILECHAEDFKLNDGIVQQIQQKNLSIQNGCRHVYYKDISEQLRVVLLVSEELNSVQFHCSGDGVMIIDWGDNSDVEHIALEGKERKISHHFNNTIDCDRQIRLYGNFNIKTWRQTENVMNIQPVSSVVVDEFYANSFKSSIKGLALFTGTVLVHMQNAYIEDLSSLVHMSLQELDLTDCEFASTEVIDKYLCDIVANYQNRRNCLVKLTTEPGPKGMEAIETIINEPAWNESGAWKFIINDIIYTYNGENVDQHLQ